ncbi:hypothetical protein C9J01_27690 [Photobacterium rosenbergii]|uniref:Uncharacterized protein n=1 Tax=Photobacterium rosenbergii TaxID=294936 RepID=A0A2T3MYJ7_9GAMM|nr:hypothetical protein [Photobacterium rosenbergii]PSW05051.1 hypothetical protein C9J01_27690 [Photobacterium rosenbergii]
MTQEAKEIQRISKFHRAICCVLAVEGDKQGWRDLFEMPSYKSTEWHKRCFIEFHTANIGLCQNNFQRSLSQLIGSDFVHSSDGTLDGTLSLSKAGKAIANQYLRPKIDFESDFFEVYCER